MEARVTVRALRGLFVLLRAAFAVLLLAPVDPFAEHVDGLGQVCRGAVKGAGVRLSMRGAREGSHPALTVNACRLVLSAADAAVERCHALLALTAHITIYKHG
jgi:hypothetical protein